MPERFAATAAVIRDAVATRAFPAAAIEVGRGAGPLWNQAFGTLTYDPGAFIAAPDTVFDIASLTKVIATTTLVMLAVDEGRVNLDAPISTWLSEWRGTDRNYVSIRDLMAHCSGLTAYLPFYRDIQGRKDFQAAICALPLEYAPRTQSVYSDLGFMLIGFILEDVSGNTKAPGIAQRPAPSTGAGPAQSLAAQFQRFAIAINARDLTFNPPKANQRFTAPTEVDPWRGRLLIGEVHDENCWALGGAAGHAGLFGTAASVGTFARVALRTIAGEPLLAQPATMHEFICRASVPGSSRALGWDTMLPTSSCGSRLSPSSIGHTGFTGTSLWIDWERDLYVVFLTNRVHPTRENEAIREIRPRVHDAVVGDLGVG
jgi:CubicO group peptidase (beta-lactamase class C family)